MNYDEVLKEIAPTEMEKTKIIKTAEDIIDFINDVAVNENINAQTKLVGSVAKGTWLSGSADIDIFICFSLETPINDLKEKGLYLAYKTSDQFNGVAEEHYASHPYLTVNISGYEVDIVPCYNIKSADQLKSAVDRTILHTNYILKNLTDDKKEEVRLLKTFMKSIGVYGSEFKVGGFAGYLCEMLILEYGTFENTLINAANWVNGTMIDLEDYGTNNLFDDSLIAIDPTDMHRNVGAALTTEKMMEFIIGCRNFLKKPKIDYFNPLKENLDKNELLNSIIASFNDRESKTLLLSFDIPDIPADNLYPQIKKTAISLKEKLEDLGFKIINYGYWSNEIKIAIILLEFDTWALSKYYTHEGPKIWNRKASNDFLSLYGYKCYLEGEFWVLLKKRKIRNPQQFFQYFLTKNKISILKIGKNLKELIINTYKLNSLDDLLKNNDYKDNMDFLNFLNDYLNPGQLLKR
ncbi:CCA tRNA nucleotidyltransferase [Methanobrevibacter filiformis]|uniref:CCA-adding enzyme n=1 Tax=Methanobrevibacter filiformis TaxID=55758 RepID=A0A166D293_9EURY|nr:CCA tRNA nucleotidyltransferase [Methanobrevibacter filiformis]KZX15129.1 tRNA nucleotidyltransferase, second domain [Methanobrevibacter filiformis]